MRIKVPPMVEVLPVGMGGTKFGLGQDDSGGDLTVGYTPTDVTSTPLPSYSGGGATTVTTPLGDWQVVNGQVFDPSGQVSSASALQAALGVPLTSVSPAGSGLTLAQILGPAAQAATTAAAIFKSTQTPGLIAGTNLVYNPATGQLLNAAGVTASGVTSLATAISPPLILGAVALFFVFMMSSGGRR